MKKLLVIFMAVLLVAAFLYGCGKQEEAEPEPEPPMDEPVETAPPDTSAMMDTMEVMDTTAAETTGEHEGH